MISSRTRCPVEPARRSPCSGAVLVVFASRIASRPLPHEVLIGKVEFAKVHPLWFVVEPYVGDDDALIVGVVGLVLLNDPHDPSNELDVGSQGPVRPEDRSHAQSGVIEAFPQHLYLHDTVDLIVTKTAQGPCLLIGVKVAR